MERFISLFILKGLNNTGTNENSNQLFTYAQVALEKAKREEEDQQTEDIANKVNDR